MDKEVVSSTEWLPYTMKGALPWLSTKDTVMWKRGTVEEVIFSCSGRDKSRVLRSS